MCSCLVVGVGGGQEATVWAPEQNDEMSFMFHVNLSTYVYVCF